jgi:adenosylmethionine-8-amino-7-oxononanoate aminotransferase
MMACGGHFDHQLALAVRASEPDVRHGLFFESGVHAYIPFKHLSCAAPPVAKKIPMVGKDSYTKFQSLEFPVPRKTKTSFATWDLAHLWHPYTRRSALHDGAPPMIVSGKGIHLHDVAGHRYLDAISSWWCCGLGHSHPRLVKQIARQSRVLQHSILGNLSHPWAAELAMRLAELMPTPDRHVLFASDGASAVEQAIKIAVQYRHNTGQPKRRRFACIDGAYHGDTLGAMSMGYLENFHRPFRDILIDADRLPFPAGGSFDAARKILDRRAGDYTAVIVEPLVLGAAGMKMYPASWLAKLAAWCKKNDVLLIVDEIATGFGRTGTMFAFEQAKVDPDIVCVGKALSSGYLPISATIVRDRIYETFDDEHTLQHGHTFCGNPIAAALALEVLKIYREEKIVAKTVAKAKKLAKWWNRFRANSEIENVRTLGLIAAFDLKSIPPHQVRLKLQERGILLRPLGKTLYIMPPLTISDAELRGLVDEVAAALK